MATTPPPPFVTPPTTLTLSSPPPRMTLHSILRMLSPTLLSIYLHEYDLPLLSSVSRDINTLVRQELRICEKRRRMKDEAEMQEIRQQLDTIESIRSTCSSNNNKLNSSSAEQQSKLDATILTQWTLLFHTYSTPLPHDYLSSFHSLIFSRGAQLQYNDYENGSGEGVCDAIALCGRWMDIKRDSSQQFRHERREEVRITISAIKLVVLSNPKLWRNRAYVGNGGWNIMHFLFWTVIHARNYYDGRISEGWTIEHEIVIQLYELLAWVIHLLEVVAANERNELEEKQRSDTTNALLGLKTKDGGTAATTSDSSPTIDSTPPISTYPPILNSRSDIQSDHPIIELDIFRMCLEELWPSRYKRAETYTVENGISPEHVRQWKMGIQRGVIQRCAESIELNPSKETFEKEMDDYRAGQYLSRLPAQRLDLIQILFSHSTYLYRFRIALQYYYAHPAQVTKSSGHNPIKVFLHLFWKDGKMSREKLTDLLGMVGEMVKNGTIVAAAASASISSSSSSFATPSSSSPWFTLLSPSSTHDDPLLRRFLTSLYFDLIRRKDVGILKCVHQMLHPFPTCVLREPTTGLSPLRYYLKKKTRCSTSLRVFDELLQEAMRSELANDVEKILADEEENGVTLKHVLMKSQNQELWDRVVVMMEQQSTAADVRKEKSSDRISTQLAPSITAQSLFADGVFHIFSFLDLPSILQSASTCRHYHTVFQKAVDSSSSSSNQRILTVESCSNICLTRSDQLVACFESKVGARLPALTLIGMELTHEHSTLLRTHTHLKKLILLNSIYNPKGIPLVSDCAQDSIRTCMVLIFSANEFQPLLLPPNLEHFEWRNPPQQQQQEQEQEQDNRTPAAAAIAALAASSFPYWVEIAVKAVGTPLNSQHQQQYQQQRYIPLRTLILEFSYRQSDQILHFLSSFIPLFTLRDTLTHFQLELHTPSEPISMPSHQLSGLRQMSNLRTLDLSCHCMYDRYKVHRLTDEEKPQKLGMIDTEKQLEVLFGKKETVIGTPSAIASSATTYLTSLTSYYHTTPFSSNNEADIWLLTNPLKNLTQLNIDVVIEYEKGEGEYESLKCYDFLADLSHAVQDLTIYFKHPLNRYYRLYIHTTHVHALCQLTQLRRFEMSDLRFLSVEEFARIISSMPQLEKLVCHQIEVESKDSSMQLEKIAAAVSPHLSAVVLRAECSCQEFVMRQYRPETHLSPRW